MRLHYYTTHAPYPYHLGIHHGQGFGSIFARLFSKVAAKTAAKSALTVAKNVGKRVLKTAIKTGTTVAKEAAKEGIREGSKAVQELATQGITNLAQKAINKGLPAESVQNISNLVQAGAHTLVNKVGTAADKGVENISSKILEEPIAERRVVGSRVRKRKKENSYSPGKQAKLIKHAIEGS